MIMMNSCPSIHAYHMGLNARKPVLRVCDQQRGRPACADQRLCYSLLKIIVPELATDEISIF